MYTGKMIDSHMHLCDLSTRNYDWLTADRPEQRQILGDGYAFLAKSFTPEGYQQLAKSQNIVGTVHLQYEANDSFLETQWLTEQAQNTHIPSAIVAKVNLSDNDAAQQLATHCQSPYLRGIRMLLTFMEGRPELSLTDQNYFLNPKWQQQFSLLKQFNLTFDVQIYDTQTDYLIEIANKNPEIKIIIDHLLWPLDPTPNGFTYWQQQISKLAKCQNVYIKISGAAVIFKKLVMEQLTPYINTVIEQFTPQRCMVGSNYPPDGIFASFEQIWNTYKILLQNLSPSEQEQIFYLNAKEFYRLD